MIILVVLIWVFKVHLKLFLVCVHYLNLFIHLQHQLAILNQHIYNNHVFYLLKVKSFYKIHANNDYNYLKDFHLQPKILLLIIFHLGNHNNKHYQQHLLLVQLDYHLHLHNCVQYHESCYYLDLLYLNLLHLE
jgi:hypothetical protein